MEAELANTILDSRKRTHQKMEELFALGRKVGGGFDGTVSLCRHKLSGQRFACKSIDKKRFARCNSLPRIRAEIRMLELLKGHPNIVAIEGCFEDENYVRIIMELCEGGDLCHSLAEKRKLSEAEATEAFKAMVQAVSFCHENHIMHRDLKIDNILLPSRHAYSALKLADFGRSAEFHADSTFCGVEGTPWYVAPEMLEGSYDERVDIWSLGVVLYTILCGFPPFDGKTNPDIFAAIQRGTPDFNSNPWPEISAEAKDLIQRMLHKNPNRRITLEDVLHHPWLGSTHPSEQDLIMRG